jgi:hypothetical protein
MIKFIQQFVDESSHHYGKPYIRSMMICATNGSAILLLKRSQYPDVDIDPEATGPDVFNALSDISKMRPRELRLQKVRMALKRTEPQYECMKGHCPECDEFYYFTESAIPLPTAVPFAGSVINWHYLKLVESAMLKFSGNWTLRFERLEQPFYFENVEAGVIVAVMGMRTYY